jgi:hypothetical protein
MAQQIYTIAQILEDLNRDLAAPEWEPIPGIFALAQAKIDELKIAGRGDSIALKVFVNTRTAEIRSFVAKVLDEPEANVLP